MLGSSLRTGRAYRRGAGPPRRPAGASSATWTGRARYGEGQLRQLIDRWHRKLYRLGADTIEIVTIAPSWMPVDERDPDDE
jgi:hypothetical protein